MIPNEPPWVVEIDGIKFGAPEAVLLLLKAVSEERDELKAEKDNYIAEIAGMRDKWTPPEEVAQLEAENEALRTGHFKQLAETDYCYVCGEHGHSHAKDCLLIQDESMSLSEIKEKYFPNRDIEDLRKKPETPISDVPITP